MSKFAVNTIIYSYYLMKQASFHLPYRILTPGVDVSTETDARLIEAAKTATQTSYAPYSHFCVGAAVLLENGEIVCGSNQENAAYPAGTCAERTAIHYANAQFPGVRPVAIAVAARKAEENHFLKQPISPCGVCRQVMIETQARFGAPFRVLLYGEEAIFDLDSASVLLPFQFDSASL